jgi:CubicO group peptidase (beta-lactamase class C family)
VTTKQTVALQPVTIVFTIALLFSTQVITATGNQATTGSSHSIFQPINISINSKELEEFVDEEITSELAASGVPGAVIIIVKNGTLLLAKGYGTMDKENNRSVIVNQTLFRIASVTKLFTWTAVMQLVEQGKLDLDTNVNKYLKTLQIPNTYPRPITLANLMSHNAGFESDEALGWVPSAADVLPLGDYLARHIPARIRPAGEVSVYSNYGASLAGYIVEQTSGLPFDEYVQTNILKRLGMSRTTLQQPPPSDLAADMSKSYVFNNGTAQPIPLGNYMGKPAGGMLSTATDMANFIMAHLQNGAYAGSRILQEATAKQMHSQLFTMDPRVPGFAHGFQEYQINGQRIIGHFGVLDAFYSSLILIPEQNLGWFIVYNGDNGIASPGAFLIAFLNHQFPTEPYTAPTSPSDFSQRAGQYTGIYRNARIPHSTFNKLISLSAEFEVTSTPQGTIFFRNAEFAEAEPDLFKPSTSSNPWNDSLLFVKDSQGQAYFSGAVGIYEKVPWYETAAFTWKLMLVTSVFFISMLVVLIARAVVNHGKPESKRNEVRLAKYPRWLCCVFSILFVTCVVGIRFAAGNLSIWLFSMAVGALGSTLALASVALVALSWKRRYWSLAERLQYTFTTAAALVFVWFLYNWNLLTFRLA